MTRSHCTTEQFGFDRLEPGLEDTFERGCVQLGLTLSPAIRQQMCDHLLLIRRWNSRLNLTAIVTPREMVIQHLLDSLAIALLVKGQHIIDIGSGGGFPGIPLAALYPDKAVTLLDSRGKRIEFLRYASANIGVKNVQTVKSRIQEFRPTVKFDTLVTRALASLSDLHSWTQHLQRPGSRLLAMKGKRPDLEIDALPEKLRSQLRVQSIEVPFLNAKRHAVIFDF